MLTYYLNLVHDKGGCRGGICSTDSYSEDYGVEIGGQCNANPDMIAFLVHMPEIIELLETSGSPISTMILRSIADVQKNIGEDLANQRDYERKDNV